MVKYMQQKKKISLISEVDWDKRNKLYQITLPPAMVDIENFFF